MTPLNVNRFVPNIKARDSIPACSRCVGMLVRVEDIAKTYMLQKDLTTWIAGQWVEDMPTHKYIIIWPEGKREYRTSQYLYDTRVDAESTAASINGSSVHEIILT